jgi:uncharacterized damage-inducible protein DinB
LNAKEFALEALERARTVTMMTIDGLTPEHFHWRPKPGANSIAFLLWHVSRVEDRFMSELRNTEEIWLTEEWHKKFTVPISENGIGWGPQQIQEFKPAMELVVSYLQRTRDVSLVTIRELDLVQFKEQLTSARPDFTVANTLQTIVYHENHHQGAIGYVYGMAYGSSQ